jgi:ABC-type Fe3+ transport system substrate-binding protein
MWNSIASRRRFTAAAIGIGWSGCLALMPASALAQDKSGQQLLADLVQKANQEKTLTAAVQSSWSRAMLPKLVEAFKSRFKLQIDISTTPIAAARQLPIEIAATKSGIAPTYDVMQGDDAETIQLTGAGGVRKIDNWKELLAAVNPDVASGKIKLEQISHGPFEGQSVLFLANIKMIVYNTNRIKEADLPKIHQELGDPKYKGRFVQPPWTSHWELTPATLEESTREKWLDVVRAAGKNSTVLSEVEGVQRVALGQFDFALAQDTYLRQMLAKDPKTPLGSMFFTDYNEINGLYYSVRTNTKSPAAATLWALWMTTPEAQSIWQPDNKSFQPYGSSALDVAERDAVKSRGAPTLGYLDNEKTTALLRWQQTPEGAKYLTAMAKAIQGE